MDEFHEFLKEVCKLPGRYTNSRDLDRVAIFLEGCDFAMNELRPDLRGTGFNGFREWLAVRLDSCVRTGWSSIITHEDTGPDKVAALERLYGEFRRDRCERGLEVILEDFERLDADVMDGKRDRTCWCEQAGGDTGDEIDDED